MVFAATKGDQSFNMMDDSRRQSGKAFLLLFIHCGGECNVRTAAALAAARKFHLLGIEWQVCLKPSRMLGSIKRYNIGYTMYFVSQVLEPFATTCLQITFWMKAKCSILRLV
jgi:hypothetical protein